GAIALHVAVAADRTKTGARFSQLPAQQHQIDDLLDVGDRVLVLSQTHGPTKNHAFRFDEDAPGILNLHLRDARLFEDVAEMLLTQRLFESLKSGRVTINKF